MKIECKCLKLETGNRVSNIDFSVEGVCPEDSLITVLRSSGELLEEVSFSKYYKGCSGSSIGTEVLPYIVRNQKFVWDVATESVTIQEFIDTHGLSLSDPIEIETFMPCGAGGLEDIIQLWNIVWPQIHAIGEMMGWGVGVKEFFQMLPRVYNFFTKKRDEIVPPDTVFSAILSRDRWTTTELAHFLDGKKEFARLLLDYLGYSWDNQQKYYIISSKQKEKAYERIGSLNESLDNSE